MLRRSDGLIRRKKIIWKVQGHFPDETQLFKLVKSQIREIDSVAIHKDGSIIIRGQKWRTLSI